MGSDKILALETTPWEGCRSWYSFSVHNIFLRFCLTPSPLKTLLPQKIAGPLLAAQKPCIAEFFPGQGLHVVSDHPSTHYWVHPRPYPWFWLCEYCAWSFRRGYPHPALVFGISSCPLKHRLCEWSGASLLGALCHISPLCAKVFSAFQLVILTDAYHFMVAGKMECKVPRDWFVNICPTLQFITLTT